jgi:hypothetical protein
MLFSKKLRRKLFERSFANAHPGLAGESYPRPLARNRQFSLFGLRIGDKELKKFDKIDTRAFLPSKSKSCRSGAKWAWGHIQKNIFPFVTYQRTK